MLIDAFDFCWRAAMTLVRRRAITVVRLVDYHGNIDHVLPTLSPLLLVFSVQVRLQRSSQVLLRQDGLLFL